MVLIADRLHVMDNGCVAHESRAVPQNYKRSWKKYHIIESIEVL